MAPDASDIATTLPCLSVWKKDLVPVGSAMMAMGWSIAGPGPMRLVMVLVLSYSAISSVPSLRKVGDALQGAARGLIP
jgi:hypothetical protein